MSEIERYGTEWLPSRQPRRLARAQDKIFSHAELSMVRLATQARLEAARLDAMEIVGRSAIQTVSMVVEYGNAAGTACPAAIPAIGQVTSVVNLAITGVVMDAANRISRL